MVIFSNSINGVYGASSGNSSFLAKVQYPMISSPSLATNTRSISENSLLRIILARYGPAFQEQFSASSGTDDLYIKFIIDIF